MFIKIFSSEIRMRLPLGWDEKLRSLEQRLSGTEKLERLEEEWSAIRARYPIEHPSPRRFKYYSGAAAVLAHYWQGEELPEEDLISKIITNPKTNIRAFEYANNLTYPNTSERKYVEKANNFLWADTSRDG